MCNVKRKNYFQLLLYTCKTLGPKKRYKIYFSHYRPLSIRRAMVFVQLTPHRCILSSKSAANKARWHHTRSFSQSIDARNNLHTRRIHKNCNYNNTTLASRPASLTFYKHHKIDRLLVVRVKTSDVVPFLHCLHRHRSH